LKRVFFVVNPASGGGSCKENWMLALPRIQAKGLTFHYEYTTGPGHATEIAKAVSSANWDVIVSVGGDGTANEVVNGLMVNVSPPIFTIFPLGTGSDSVRTLGITDDMDRFLGMVNMGQIRFLDVGVAAYNPWEENEVKYRYFINACDVGIGASVAAAVNEMNRDRAKKAGNGKFFRAIMEQVVKFESFGVKVVDDREGKVQTQTVIVAVCNGRYFGGGVHIAPNAKMDDGRLELVTTKEMSKVALLGIIRSIYKGTHIHHPKVIVKSASQFKVETWTPQLLETDGEVVDKVSKVNFGVLEKALKVIY